MTKISCTPFGCFDSNLFIYQSAIEHKNEEIMRYLKQNTNLYKCLTHFNMLSQKKVLNPIVLPPVYKELQKYSDIKGYDVIDYIENQNYYAIDFKNLNSSNFAKQVEKLAVEYSTPRQVESVNKLGQNKKYVTKRPFSLHKNIKTKEKEISTDAKILAHSVVAGFPFITNNTNHFIVNNLPQTIAKINIENGFSGSCIPYSCEQYFNYLKKSNGQIITNPNVFEKIKPITELTQ
ncbi:MAG: hypothetical protein PHQ62_01210 [Clostridia bacterium]|nr:hypothetical protein [Clostridia bacterium]